jgi:hypothetical protein
MRADIVSGTASYSHVMAMRYAVWIRSTGRTRIGGVRHDDRHIPGLVATLTTAGDVEVVNDLLIECPVTP